MHEAIFRIEGGGAYAGATAETDVSVELWCNDHCDLLYVSGEEVERTLSHVRDLVGVKDALRREGRPGRPDELVIVTAECLRRHEADLVETYLARHGCLLLPPLRYARGAKSCRVVALDPAALTGFYRDLVDDGFSIQVDRTREVDTPTQDAPLLTLDSVLPDLSSRQREVLSLAYERGYYEIPRGTTTTELAKLVGIERRTAEEHLRRAENKLVAALAEYVRS